MDKLEEYPLVMSVRSYGGDERRSFVVRSSGEVSSKLEGYPPGELSN